MAQPLTRNQGISIGLILAIISFVAELIANRQVPTPQPVPAVVTVDPAPAPPAPSPVVVPPSPGPAPEPEPKPAPNDLVSIAIYDANGVRIDNRALEEAARTLTVGTWTVEATPPPNGTKWTKTITVSDGVKPPPVVPPAPTPPVPPEPQPPTPPVPVPPQPIGALSLLLIHETADTTPEFARLITDLRTDHADYLKSKSHTLSILQDDDKDENGNPSSLVAAWRPFYSGLKLPALLIIDPRVKLVVHKQSLEPTATAEQIMSRVKELGG